MLIYGIHVYLFNKPNQLKDTEITRSQNFGIKVIAHKVMKPYTTHDTKFLSEDSHV
jgi:hypothetical protein